MSAYDYFELLNDWEWANEQQPYKQNCDTRGYTREFKIL